PAGESWLGGFLGVSPQEALPRLRALKILHDLKFIVNPNLLVRAPHVLKDGAPLDYEDPRASHRLALINDVVPTLKRLTLSRRFPITVWVDGRELPATRFRPGSSLANFLRKHLPEALTKGVYIWNYFVPADLVADYIVLPGDFYHLQEGGHLSRSA